RRASPAHRTGPDPAMGPPRPPRTPRPRHRRPHPLRLGRPLSASQKGSTLNQRLTVAAGLCHSRILQATRAHNKAGPRRVRPFALLTYRFLSYTPGRTGGVMTPAEAATVYWETVDAYTE